jgi:hypothetical protein
MPSPSSMPKAVALGVRLLPCPKLSLWESVSFHAQSCRFESPSPSMPKAAALGVRLLPCPKLSLWEPVSFHAQSCRFGSLPPSMPTAMPLERPLQACNDDRPQDYSPVTRLPGHSPALSQGRLLSPLSKLTPQPAHEPLSLIVPRPEKARETLSRFTTERLRGFKCFRSGKFRILRLKRELLQARIASLTRMVDPC